MASLLSRGKKMLRTSIIKEMPKRSGLRRVSPLKEAEWWIQCGLDRDDLEVKFISKDIGSGVFAKSEFQKGDFLVEYAGERISELEGIERDRTVYRKEKHSYLYYFKHQEKTICIDASRNVGRIGRMINDSTNFNSKMKKIFLGNVSSNIPYLALFATRTIKVGEEIVYDYGDDNLPWRKMILTESESDYDSDPFGLNDEDPILPLTPDENPTEPPTQAENPAVPPTPDEKPPVPPTRDENPTVPPTPDENPTVPPTPDENPTVPPTPDENPTVPPTPDENPTVPPTPDENPTVPPTPDENPTVPPTPDENPTVPPTPDENPTVPPAPDENPTVSPTPDENPTVPPTPDENPTVPPAPDENPTVPPTPDENPKVPPTPDENPTVPPTPDENPTVPPTPDENPKVPPTPDENPTVPPTPDEDPAVPPTPDENPTVPPTPDDNPPVPPTPDEYPTVPHTPDENPTVPPTPDENPTVSPTPDENPIVPPTPDEYPTVPPTPDEYAKVLPTTDEYAKVPPTPDEYPTVPPTPDEYAKVLPTTDEYAKVPPTPDEYPTEPPTPDEYPTGPPTPAENPTMPPVASADKIVVDENSCSSDCSAVIPNLCQFLNQADENADNLPKKDFVCLICDKHFKKLGGLRTHMKMHSASKAGVKYKKPLRPCPFCEVLQSRMTRHIELKHSEIPEVFEALNLPKGSTERNQIFSNFRKKGIYEYNLKQASLETPMYVSERRNQTDLVQCSGCKGFYGRSLFYRHKDSCAGDSVFSPVAVHMKTIAEDDDFARDILSRFQRNEVGDLCRNDDNIRIVGRRLFQKNLRRVDKTMESIKATSADMRLLARLYLAFKEKVDFCSGSSEDMFKRTNFHALEEATEMVTKPEGVLKYGVKNQVYYLLKNSSEIIIANHLSKGDDSRAEEVEKFQRLLKLNKDQIFGDAAYAINLSRQENLRVPEKEATEDDIERLSKYIQTTIAMNSSDFVFHGQHEFVELRDAVCARLTLFNARRGGEPSRLKLSQLNDAWNNRWIASKDVEKLEKWEQKLFSELKIAYQPGKGNHLVPVLITQDLVEPLKLLSSYEVRKRATVDTRNIYVFPMTESSINHVQGWYSINRMCKLAGVHNPDLLTATKQRHRISTIYCGLQVPEGDRQYFYKHMGHSQKVNQGTYQSPLPILEVTKVGKHLQNFDKENWIPRNISKPDLQLNSLSDSTKASTSPANKRTMLQQKEMSDDSHEEDIETGNISSDLSSPVHRRKRKLIISSDESDEDDYFSDDRTPVKKKMTRKHSSTKNEVKAKEIRMHSSAKGRSYFRWTTEVTNQIKKDFENWISLPTGNTLPSKSELLSYLEEKPLACSCTQLRTKLMNEQNKRQKLRKKRLSDMEVQ